ncbi:hypothetical protein LCGC14_0376230 [marine sediment metagenome]|uniref:Uncharacterized protein n=1 Tax=marine sediment metagenome TaxID=412755 RepID=A0A0F9T3W0_9ZZZZ
MWIWIGIGWVLCGILAFVVMWRGWGVCFNGRYQWAQYIESIICFVLGVIGLIIALLMVGKYCFKRRTKMKIYWDENLQQIRTRGGKCLLDRTSAGNYRGIVNGHIAVIQDMGKRIRALEDIGQGFAPAHFRLLDKLEKQLQCSAKTQGKHKMVFVKKGSEETTTYNNTLPTPTWFVTYTYSYGTSDRDFVFKCSVCDLEITKTEKELSAVEKEGLKKLKLL